MKTIARKDRGEATMHSVSIPIGHAHLEGELIQETGALEQKAELAADWFRRNLRSH